MNRCTSSILLVALSAVMGFSGCDDDDPSSAVDAGPMTDAAAEPEPEPGECAAIGEGLKVADFQAGGLAEPITEVDCELSDGSMSRCYQVVIPGEPSDHDVGPFCPRNISDGPEAGGIWLESGTVYDVDGSFITGLADLYDDPNWQLYDADTGVVNVTLTLEACEAAARPDVDPQYQNHCVECNLADLGGGFSDTFLIPVTPTPRATPAEIGVTPSVGVALNGVRYDPPAPVAAILGAYTIAAFDDCGGHVNPAVGYHYHAATGCTDASAQCDDHAPLIGYALDGYAMYAMAGADGVEAADLDECRGHTDDLRGYHYHSAGPGENMFLGCFHGLTAGADAGTGPGGGGGGEAMNCAGPDATMCCGDDICDGPETAANCAADCQ